MTNQTQAVLMTRFDAPRDGQEEWNDWYETNYLAHRLELPGFLAARRYEVAKMLPEKFVVPGPSYLTVMELQNLAALEGREYRELVREEESAGPGKRFNYVLPELTGGAYEQFFPEEGPYEIPEGAGFLLAVGHSGIPREVVDEYHAWYNTEHIPSYLGIPGLMTARRFHKWEYSHAPGLGLPTEGPDFIALYDLANDKVFETEEFKARSGTPWSSRIRGYTWERRKMNQTYRLVSVLKAAP
ncbi:hypothetical protein ACFLUT_02370 [Chloroflexota bacterium]